MARYKDVHYDQDKFIPASFHKQILPGTFEYTLSYLIDHKLDLSVFDRRYHKMRPVRRRCRREVRRPRGT